MNDPFATEPVLTGDEKFHTCKFRTEFEESRFIKTCNCENSTLEIKGFDCIEKNIFPVNPDICQYCKSYQRKDG